MTGSLSYENIRKSGNLLSSRHYFERRLEPLDEIIRRESGIPVVKVGSIIDEYGGGTVRPGVSDDKWTELLVKLALHAHAIFVIPFSSASSMWEVREICDRRLLHKTVFLIPEARLIGSAGGPAGLWIYENLPRVWHVSRSEFRRIGIRFPRMELGSMFVSAQEADPERRWLCATLTGKRLRHFSRYIGRADSINFGSPLAEANEHATFDRYSKEEDEGAIEPEELDAVRNRLIELREQLLQAS